MFLTSGADFQADAVIVNGAAGDDAIAINGDATGISVLGLAAQVHITGAEAANDRLIVNALDGDDVIEASGLAAGVIGLTASGDDGNDILIGSEGDDTPSAALAMTCSWVVSAWTYSTVAQATTS